MARFHFPAWPAVCTTSSEPAARAGCIQIESGRRMTGEETLDSRCRRSAMNPMPAARPASTPSARPEPVLTARTLRRQNQIFRGTGGVSAENRTLGFVPAFLDTQTGAVYRACFADGRPAPMHLLDGLPSAVVEPRRNDGPGNRPQVLRPSGFSAGGAILYPRTGRRRSSALMVAGSTDRGFSRPRRHEPRRLALGDATRTAARRPCAP